MIFGSVCSGHDAVSQALLPRGWECAFLAEVEAFPCAVLAERFGATAPRHHLDPTVLPEKDRAQWVSNNKELTRMAARGVFGAETPNLGDFTKIDPAEWSNVEWLWGGTPCQAFSVAGARQGLKDHRGNLTLAFVGLAHELASTGSLRGVTWENVPGVLSSRDNAFGCFLGALVGHDAPIVSPHGKGRWTDAGVVSGPRARAAWRILDTQHFGLPQRRRRVFVVASFGDGPDPVGILFERQGVLGAAAQSLGSRQGPARYAQAGAGAGFGGGVTYDLAPSLTASGRGVERIGETRGQDPVIAIAYPGEVAHTLRAEGFDASEDGTGRGTPLVPMVYSANVSPTLRAGGNSTGGDRPPGTDVDTIDTLLPMASVYSAMPMNSGKDFVVREVEVAQPVLAGGPGLGNQGGDYVVQPIAKAFSLRGRDGENQIEPEAGDVAPALRTGEGGSSKSFVATQVLPILEAGARTGTSTTDVRAGLSIGEDGDPMFTLQAGKQHALGVGPAYPISADALRAGEALTPSPDAEGKVRLRNPGLGIGGEGEPAATIQASGPGAVAALMDFVRWAVRRLTPKECERLQGTDDEFTRIPWRNKPASECPDGPRYKVLGNSMSVDVILWIGVQIEVACGRMSNHG